ncbi:type II toxin-antitoxin system VapC family toxin [Dyadobacter frigoris]|uniref:Type II toxin-antitoxin system VapC family toxin n=1 Tax=Dyadobacter frigoris TaxID=2576211 RepID=A0A4U6DG83_9BACT|nr:type II toxin-antitoxin system VapC family toxin [Dyadobacter frigoris]
MDKVIIDICVSLRKTQKIKLSDTIIAATALVHGYTLITNNEKDFANLKDLDVVNLHKM